ncbi:hypothetical protein Bca4012_056759 [Brassica carinata]
MVLIFHLDMFSDLDMQVFQIWKTYGTTYLLVFWDDLLVSLPDDFQEVFQTTSIVWTSWKSSDEVFFHIKWSPSLSL